MPGPSWSCRSRRARGIKKHAYPLNGETGQIFATNRAPTTSGLLILHPARFSIRCNRCRRHGYDAFGKTRAAASISVGGMPGDKLEGRPCVTGVLASSYCGTFCTRAASPAFSATQPGCRRGAPSWRKPLNNIQKTRKLGSRPRTGSRTAIRGPAYRRRAAF